MTWEGEHLALRDFVWEGEVPKSQWVPYFEGADLGATYKVLVDKKNLDLIMCDTPLEVMATAKSLINDSTIFRLEGGEVEYFHILFDTHEIVWANGAPSESFHPGEQGMSSLEEEVRAEIYTLSPELEQGIAAYGPSARMRSTSLKMEHIYKP